MLRFSYVYNKFNRLNKKGKAPVYLEIYKSRVERKFLNTKVYLAPSEWDENRLNVSVDASCYVAANKLLREFRDEKENIYYNHVQSGKPFEWSIFDNPVERKTISFTEFFEEQLEQDESIRLSTKRDHRKTLAKLTDFKKVIEFSQINYGLIRDFDNYLRKKKLSTNTIWSHHKTFKRYINLYLKLTDTADRVLKENPYKDFSTEKENGKKEFLTMKEVRRIAELEVDGRELELCKDLFLIMCYTGLRISDADYLLNSSILEHPDGLVIDLGRMRKTDKPVYLPCYELFGGAVLPLLEKYRDERNEYLLPIRLRSKMAKNLRLIADGAKIKKKLTSHVGRHTFGTNLAMATGSVFIVKKFMGISKVDTAMIYINLAKSHTAESLKGVDWSKLG